MRISLRGIWFSHCLLWLIPFIANGETHVGGSVSGNWTSASSPYVVDSTVIILAGNSLTIWNGVEVFFTGPDSVKVYGQLTVAGLSEDSVYFRDLGLPQWRGIWFFQGASSLSTIEYAHIEKPLWGVRTNYCVPTVKNSLIIAQSWGVWAYWSDMILLDCVIYVDTNNMDGIYLRNSNAQIWNCEVHATNTNASTVAVGIHAFESDPYVLYCTILVNGDGLSYGLWLENVDKGYFKFNLINVISKNLAYGMLLNHSSYPIFINNTIAVESENAADKCVSLWDNSNPLIENSILYGDLSSQGVVAQPNCRPNLQYDDFANNTPGQELVGCSAGEGSIFEDPLFVDPSGGDFDLTFGSPCINAGNPDSPLDPDNTRADMGCYYYPIITALPPATAIEPEGFGIMAVAPNPFNSMGVFRIVLPEAQNGRLLIYNQQGRLVSELKEGVFPAGWQRYTWDAISNGSGIYWIVLETDRLTSVRSFVLLK